MAQPPETRRDLSTITMRLDTYCNLQRQVNEIPPDFAPLDKEQLVREVNLVKISKSLRRELKADLKWLQGFVCENRPANAEYVQALQLFDQILEAI